MLLSLILYLQALRWFAPAALLLGSSPAFFSVWASWRLLSSVMPRRVFRAGDDTMYSTYQRFVLFFFEHYAGIQIYLYGDVDKILEKKEKVFYISNHQCTVDWVVSNMLAIRQGSLGHVRYILKDGLKYFPLYGFYFAQHGCVYVKRSGKFEESRTSKKLIQLAKDNVNTWMVVFPEGTRYNPELPDMISKSQNFAKEEGFEVLNNVLAPRHKAVYIGLSHLRESLDAVYDITIGYNHTMNKDGERLPAPSMPDFLSGQTSEIHIHIKRYDIEDVPEDINGLRLWLHQRFVEKEKLMTYFYKNKENPETFPGVGVLSETSFLSTIPSLFLCTGMVVAALATEKGRSCYWKLGLFYTLSLNAWMRFRY
ncbi:hypothetical protein LOTGIDRAFT_219426 [Lottia gigantea]|uniref:Phospholipid/glycerol acyltransferase domain-containing protein n=1 Tax=Lottia gigantea TaxID=225164 RepID=V4A095_LOTGI|nr:hypothetical protein LOTGIDRAFT_219426 [Lottia gigantea]ESO88325.1 hypothetical protein LOTGIDRAFT_219426 [Lottia gigantea]